MAQKPSMSDKDDVEHSSATVSGKIAKRSFGVTIAMSIGAAMELARDVAIVRLLGTGLITDAFFLGIVIPVTFAGALQTLSRTVFLPWFGESLSRGRVEAQERFCLLFLVSLLPSLLIVLAGILFAPQVAALLVGTNIDLDLLTSVARFALPVVGLAIEIAVFTAYLNATGHYTTVAARKALNVGAFLIVLYWQTAYYSTINLGTAFLAGWLVEFSSLAIVAFRGIRRRNITHAFGHWDELLIVLRSSLFPAIAFGFARLNLVVERVLAGYLTVGSVSAVTLARRSTRAIATIAAQGVNTVTLSEMSRLRTKRDLGEGKNLLTSSIRLAILLLVPIATFLIAFHKPITKLLFAGRSANLQVLLQTANLMLLFGIAIPFTVIAPLLLSAFFAVGDTRTPSVQKIVTVALNIVLNLILVWSLGTTLGIGIAFLLTMFFSTIWAGISVSRHFGPFTDRLFIGFVVKVLMSAVMLVVVTTMIYQLLAASVTTLSDLSDAGLIFISSVAGGFAFIVTLYALRVEEIVRTWHWTRSKALIGL